MSIPSYSLCRSAQQLGRVVAPAVTRTTSQSTALLHSSAICADLPAESSPATSAAATTDSTAVAETKPPQYIKVRQYRSTIGLHKKIRNIADAMGLKRNGTVKVFPVAPNVVGNLVYLKEIIKVELVNTQEIVKVSPEKGYKVVGKYEANPYL
ncbi:hypothetical protein H4R33_003497 [Dimargaris cristalligena]|nr:hypothetical protein H4R33_003497 [Dimargaris cristalligena]